MNEPSPRTPTHFYDTRTRAISCGEGKPDDHSTKHARGVTCPTCLELIEDAAPRTGERRAGPGVSPLEP